MHIDGIWKLTRLVARESKLAHTKPNMRQEIDLHFVTTHFQICFTCNRFADERIRFSLLGILSFLRLVAVRHFYMKNTPRAHISLTHYNGGVSVGFFLSCLRLLWKYFAGKVNDREIKYLNQIAFCFIFKFLNKLHMHRQTERESDHERNEYGEKNRRIE